MWFLEAWGFPIVLKSFEWWWLHKWLLHRSSFDWVIFLMTRRFMHPLMNLALYPMPPISILFFQFAIFLVCIIRYLSRVFQDRSNGPMGIALSHCFGTAVQMNIRLRTTLSFAEETFTRERILSLDKAITKVNQSLNRVSISLSRLAPIVGKVFGRECQCHLFQPLILCWSLILSS